MSISSDPESADAVRAAALARFVEDWQAEHGALTPAEIAKAERELFRRPGRPAE